MNDIKASNLQKHYLKDVLYSYELFYFFAWRDIIVRYKQAIFGVAWALIRPLLTMLLFTLVFNRIAHLPSENVNYAFFVLAGMLPWQIFSNTINDACQCLLNNSHLISKVYFPRIIIPSSLMIVHLVDLFIGLLLLVPFGLYFGAINLLTFASLPLFLLLTMFLCLGGGFWVSALTVKYRDFRFIIPFMVQFGVFVSPVGYGTFLIPNEWIWLYMLNPIVGIIDGFRWCFFGISYPYLLYSISISIVMTLFLFVTGFLYFRRMERSMGDIL
jgi:lipopolysaccharide transport system permease protein